MKRFGVIVAVWIAILAAAEVALNRTDGAAGAAPAIAGAPAPADALARGEYLTKAADCVACHTVPESGRPFAGGVAFKLPIGTIYSSNITADPINGIGGLGDDAFLPPRRDGDGQKREHLYPAVLYRSYLQPSAHRRAAL